jgi:hypothetical protein
MTDRALLIMILKFVKALAELRGPYHSDHQMYDLINEAKKLLENVKYAK